VTAPDPELTGATVELLQALIRTACVNDGTPSSGQEVRNAELLAAYLDVPGIELTHHEPIPGRRSVVATLEGSDADAPTIGLLGHTDVVPVTAERWREDPFGGELIDGEVWGRGAVDMLNLTASMAVALRTLAGRAAPTARHGALPRGRRRGSRWGLGRRLARRARWDEVACDYVLTESGGCRWRHHGPGSKVVMGAAEKGIGWRRLVVHGTPGHGSVPYGADNA
jgi:acetylornithine deacetylase/succinyl-diaminopimelate desuccinylase-like protein